MSGDMVQYDDNGVADSTEGGEDGAQGQDGQGSADGEQRQEQPARPHHAGRQERDGAGKFAGGVKPEPERKETPPPPARLKFKVPKEDGEGEEEVELAPEDVARRLAEARALARERKEERQRAEAASREVQAYRDLAKGLKEGKDRGGLLRRFIRDSGLTPEDAEEALAEALHGELQDASLTPEQRRLKELEEREAQRVEQEKQQKAEAEFQKFTDGARAKEAEYAKVWGEAIAKFGLPATPRLLADVATYHITQKKAGISLTSDELAKYAVEEFDRGLGVRLKDVTPEQFSQRFPEVVKGWKASVGAMAPEDFLKEHPDLGRKLLLHFREKARTASRPGVGPTRPPPRAPAPAKQEPAPVFYDEWRR